MKMDGDMTSAYMKHIWASRKKDWEDKLLERRIKAVAAKAKRDDKQKYRRIDNFKDDKEV